MVDYFALALTHALLALAAWRLMQRADLDRDPPPGDPAEPPPGAPNAVAAATAPAAARPGAVPKLAGPRRDRPPHA